MGKFLRFIGILFLGLTAAFTLLGGAGTVCVSINAEKYASMVGLVPYKWLYWIFTILTTAVGVMGIRAIINLLKGKTGAYMFTIITLILGIVTGVIRMGASRALRGKSMPIDMVVYTTVITLIIFLLFKIPSVWEKVDFERKHRKEGDTAGGAAAIVMGILCLTIHVWMGPTHTWGGINYADAFNTVMNFTGWGLVTFGTGIMTRSIIKAAFVQPHKELKSSGIIA
ncbi:hypothetical protein ACFL20_04770 [Spirochaetota bacterium]